MYLDDLPDVAEARQIKGLGRGHPITDGERAVAVAFTGDGAAAPNTWIVRFELAARQEPRRRLADAFVQTGATALWFFGGDRIARRAAADLELEPTPLLAVLVRRAEPTAPPAGITLRTAEALDMETRMLIGRHVDAYRAPRFAAAVAGGETVGFGILEELAPAWSEISAFVYPSLRRRGYGAEILAKAADAAERTGRTVCAAIPVADQTGRGALERAGFRLADYYFVARSKGMKG